MLLYDNVYMLSQRGLVNYLKARRITIIEFLSTLFLVSSLAAVVAFLTTFVTEGSSGILGSYFIFKFVLIIMISITTLYIRIRLIKINYKTSFYIIVSFLLISAYIILFQEGTETVIPYILITVSVLSTSIILTVRKALGIYILSFIVTFVIIILQYKHIIVRDELTTIDDVINTSMYLFFVWVATNIAKIGYDQIEDSYQKAIDYAKELEVLNRNLDKKVHLRTRQLEESFEKQMDSVHNAAVMGSVAKPMLHDLASPISSIQSTFNLVDTSNFDKNNLEILNMGKKALEQIIRIVDNGRELMRGQKEISRFSPYELISNAIFILKNEIDKNRIKVITDINPKIKLDGMSTLFERMFINIFFNAIDELRHKEDIRIITVSGKNVNKYFELRIKDNGRGIPHDMIEKIFDADFSLKSESGHLGLGLPFVKSVVEKTFSGKISVNSKIGKYTEFVLSFKLKKNGRRKRIKKSS